MSKSKVLSVLAGAAVLASSVAAHAGMISYGASGSQGGDALGAEADFTTGAGFISASGRLGDLHRHRRYDIDGGSWWRPAQRDDPAVRTERWSVPKRGRKRNQFRPVHNWPGNVRARLRGGYGQHDDNRRDVLVWDGPGSYPGRHSYRARPRASVSRIAGHRACCVRPVQTP